MDLCILEYRSVFIFHVHIVFMEQVFKENKVSISILKHSFAKKFPTSTILQTLLSLPNEVEGEELIGAVGVWLNILDMKSATNPKVVNNYDNK